MSRHPRQERSSYGRVLASLSQSSRPMPGVQPTNAQPKCEAPGASTSPNLHSSALPGEDDLFDLFINYPAEDKQKAELPTFTPSSSVNGSTANHVESAHIIPENNSLNTSALPESIDAPYIHGDATAHNPLPDTPDQVRPHSTSRSSRRTKSRRATPGYYSLFVEVEGTFTGSPEVRRVVVEIQVPLPRTNSPQSAGPVASTHTTAEASSSANRVTGSPATAESVQAANVSSNTVHFSSQVSYGSQSFGQTPLTSQSQAHTVNEAASSQPNTARQRHLLPQALASVPSRAVTPKHQVRNKKPGVPNLAFNPTPLKQSWTPNDFAPKNATGRAPNQPARVQASVQSPTLAPAQLSIMPQSDLYSPATLIQNVVYGAPSHYHSQDEATIPGQEPAVVPQGSLGPTQTFGPAYPWAPPQTEHQPAQHPNTLSQGTQTQGFQSFPRHQAYPRAPLPTLNQPIPLVQSSYASQTSSMPTWAPNLPPTQSYTQASHNPSTALPQQTQSYACFQTSPPTEPSIYNQQVPSAQPRSVPPVPASSNPLGSSSTQLPEYSNSSPWAQGHIPRTAPSPAHPSHSAPSIPAQSSPEGPFTMAPRLNKHTFSTLRWQVLGSEPSPFPSQGNSASLRAYEHSTYAQARSPVPFAQTSALGPSTSTHSYIPNPYYNQSNYHSSSLSQPTTLWTSSPVAKNKKRRAEADSDRSHTQGVPTHGYRASLPNPNKRAKYEGN